ncbi:MAG: hypothetical protein WA364_14160 [Candidatus Nitrosopolaris sp.]
MPRVIHFEIVGDKPERVMKFYKEVFGWEFNKWNGPQDYWFKQNTLYNLLHIDMVRRLCNLLHICNST